MIKKGVMLGLILGPFPAAELTWPTGLGSRAP